jgi:hypothetical protein
MHDIEGLVIANTAFRQVLHTLYAPPNHRDGVVRRARAEAEADHEQSDGTTTE